MGMIAEVSNSRIYDALNEVLKMINDSKSIDKIKIHIECEMRKCAEEM